MFMGVDFIADIEFSWFALIKETSKVYLFNCIQNLD